MFLFCFILMKGFMKKFFLSGIFFIHTVIFPMEPVKFNNKVRNNSYRTGLHYAIFNKNKDEIVKLVKSGEDVNIQNYDGNTPLHLAVLHDSCEIAKLLLNLGAQKNIKNEFGDIPVKYAKSLEMYSLLKPTCDLCDNGNSNKDNLIEDDIFIDLFIVPILYNLSIFLREIFD